VNVLRSIGSLNVTPMAETGAFRGLGATSVIEPTVSGSATKVDAWAETELGWSWPTVSVARSPGYRRDRK
jgi:hypothetical protein